ncbi:MAG: class I SAM-dependent methyltransferase [Acidimicrobiales bacterium]
MFRQTAHVYDLVYLASGKDYAAESAAVHEVIQTRNPGASTLLDVACGTGGHLHHLQDRYTVTGVDIDPAMLDQARAHLPGLPLVEADMRTVDLGNRFDAVVCLFSSIGYMADTTELGAAIQAIARHLHPGGVLVVDGWVRSDSWRDGAPPHVDVASADGLRVVRVGRSRRERNTTYLEMHHLIATCDHIEHVVEHHKLMLFSHEEYLAAFTAAGLTVETLESPMEGRDRYVGVLPG